MVTFRVFMLVAGLAALFPTIASAQNTGAAPGAGAALAMQGIGPSPPPSPGSCRREIAGARLGLPSGFNVQLDPNTLWRPPGSEVRFTIASASGTPPQVVRVYACFRWELRDRVPDAADAHDPGYTPSMLVRGIPESDGTVEYGAMVPALAVGPSGYPPESEGAVRYVGSGTVPVADMQVLIELTGGQWLAVVLPVGVTDWVFAMGVLMVMLAVAGVILWVLASRELAQCYAAMPPPAGDDIRPAPPGGRRGKILRSISLHVLAVISDDQNVASLSQLQVMLWTFLVGGAATYVMALSGNLIEISGGTLALLGIAGGTLVVAQIDPKSPPPVVRLPNWAQLLQKDALTQNIDVTRVQMLIFTLITAAFVAIKVAASYSIPEIPDNFLVLMGISNGVYLAGRKS